MTMDELKATAICRKWAKRIGLGFHPDTHGADYVPAMSKAEIADYERNMATLFGLRIADPYAVAVAALEWWNNGGEELFFAT